jgi:hypothetical protein
MRGRRWVVALVCAVGALACSATAFALAASQDGVSATFQPWASSFVSPASGFALGGIGCRFGVNGAQQPCKPVVVATSDAGGSWRRLSAPPTLLQWILTSAGGPAVRAITFADSRDGWLYSPSLWATHDGGAHWTRTGVKGLVVSVVVGGGWAYAAVDEATGIGAETPSLLRSPVNRDDWQPVGSLPGSIATGDGGWLLAASGGSVWAGTVPTPTSTSDPVLWRSVDGAPWQRLGNPCGSGSLASLTASSASDVVMLCGGGTLQIATSSDGGANTQRVPAPGKDAFGGPLAAPLNTSKIIVFAYPLREPSLVLPSVSRSWLDRTADSGKSWTGSPYSDHAGWADLQFSSPTVGWVTHGYPGATVDQLMRTTDAGASFKPVRF